MYSCFLGPVFACLHKVYLGKFCVSTQRPSSCVFALLRYRHRVKKKLVCFDLVWFLLIGAKLPSVLCCARILVLTFGFEGKNNLWGAVGVSLFRVWLTWEETPCQVRDCCKYLSVEGYQKESLCLQRNFFWYLSRCAVPS